MELEKEHEDDEQMVLFDVGATLPRPLPPEHPPEEPRPVIDLTLPMPFAPLTGARFSEDRMYRYNLWRRFKEKGTTQLMVAVNPSIAGEEINDPSITRMEGFSRRDGHALLIVANLFAYVATNPKDMKKQIDPVGPKNNEWLVELRKKADVCVVCWGNEGRFRSRDQEVIDLLKSLGPLYCFGRNKPTKGGKPGTPKHPLYLRADTKLQPFEV